MDVHWIDVRLRDGRIFRKLVVRGDRYITGRDDDPNGEGELPFGAGYCGNQEAVLVLSAAAVAIRGVARFGAKMRVPPLPRSEFQRA